MAYFEYITDFEILRKTYLIYCHIITIIQFYDAKCLKVFQVDVQKN